AGVLENALGVLLAFARLTRMDFRCMPTAGEETATGAVESGEGPPAGGGEAGEASGIARANQQLAVVNTTLANFPTPFTVANLLDWLRRIAAIRHEAAILAGTIPVVDDIIDPLNTLTAWHAADSAQIRDDLAQSIQDLAAFTAGTAPGRLNALGTDIAAAAAALDSGTLASVADGLTLRLNALAAAVSAGELGASGPDVSQIMAHLDDYDGLRAAMAGGLLADLADLSTRLENLGGDLADEMGHLVSVLRPNPAIGGLAAALPASSGGSDLSAAIEAQFQPLSEWLDALLSALDLQAIQAPIQSVAETVREGVEGLEQSLTQVTVQVRAVFGQVEEILDGFDTAALAHSVEEAIDRFEAELTGRISALFAPVQTAVSGLVDLIGEQAGDVLSEETLAPLRNALADVVNALAGVLAGAADTLQPIRDALENVKNQVEQLSFAPLTDGVVAGLDAIADALAGIDPALLNAALETALQTALAVLPDDLQPLTDPLIDEFGALVASGPVPLVAKVKDQPAKLLQKIKAFEPAALVGDVLSDPLNDLISRMEAFQPSSLLAPVAAEIAKLRGRLKDQASPGRLLGALEPPFEDLLAQFDRFSPAALVQPLENAVSQTIARMLDVMPTDAVLEQVDAALDAVRDVSGFGQNLVQIFTRINELLAGLADAETQLDAWTAGILDKVAAIADLGPLQARFDALAAALDATRAAALQGAFDAAAAPLEPDLATLNPEARHAALIQAYSRFPRAALEALPASPVRTDLLAALDRFDPLDPAFGAPYQSLRRCARALAKARSDLSAALAEWDARYHGPDGTLAQFRAPAATPSQIRGWLQTEIDRSFLAPLRVLLRRVGDLAAPLAAFFDRITALVAALQARIDDLLLGPDALGGIRDALDTVMQRLRDFNLDFLSDSLEALFAELRGRIDALHPRHLKDDLDAAFDAMLARIDLDLVLPAGALQDLDDTYAGVLDRLRALDPEALLTETVQPLYEDTVLPLIATFDITPLLTAIIERLQNLDGELKSEMQRVNEAFRGLKRAVPGGSGGAAASIAA
ncbi:MAG TPA: hypothetical protein VK852_13515, partial [Desulfobacterales bacterium]|nr:hypothetical protein [Desulfobacterales bacterium]